MKTRFLLVTAMAAFLAASCADKGPVEPEVKAELTLQGISDVQNVVAEASNLVVTVTSNVAWTLEAGKEDWIHFDMLDGKAGESKLTVSFDANTQEESRRTSFTVTAAELQKQYTVIQAAYVKPLDPVSLSVTGLADNKVSVDYNAAQVKFKVNCNYAWSIDAAALSFGSLEPQQGMEGETEVTLTIPENTLQEARQGSFSVVCKEETVQISVEQGAAPEPVNLDSHPAGHVFFSDDFAWVATTWDSTYPKYGWVSAKTDGTHNNEYAVNNVEAAKSEADKIGYVCDGCCYAKAEGFIKLGKAAQIGSITTPALSGIDAGTIATLALSFNAGLYCSASKAPDSYQYIQVSIEGEGVIASCGTPSAQVSADGKSAEIPLSADEEHIWKWTRKSLIIQGADAQTKIRFGSADAKQGRCFVDDIRIERAADKGATPASDSVSSLPLDYSATLDNSDNVPAAGGSLGACLRVNADFSVRSDAAWLTIGQIAYATSTTASNSDGVVIADDLRSATVTRTAMPYNRTLFVAAANDTPASRTAHVTVSAGGQDLVTLTITQEAMTYSVQTLAKWTMTSVFNAAVYNHTDGKSYTSEAYETIGKPWVTSMSVPSDVVKGGLLTAVNGSGKTLTPSTGTASNPWNRLRLKGVDEGDGWAFKVSGVTASAGSKMELKNVYLGCANAGTIPTAWELQYSLNGTDWTKIRDVAKPSSGTDFISLDAEVELQTALSNGDFHLRLVATAPAVTQSNSIPFILVSPTMPTTSYATRTKLYTEPSDYVVINLLKK